MWVSCWFVQCQIWSCHLGQVSLEEEVANHTFSIRKVKLDLTWSFHMKSFNRPTLSNHHATSLPPQGYYSRSTLGYVFFRIGESWSVSLHMIWIFGRESLNLFFFLSFHLSVVQTTRIMLPNNFTVCSYQSYNLSDVLFQLTAEYIFVFSEVLLFVVFFFLH